ncbi:hypothetical protein EB796_011828 [Bugula neritina]|uniref:Regulator of MON1-CCZ1 complex N-terminal domain-containing protein n=1 Tax=Bugula neritina TaxID=10212 RepID=A0A7J7JW19_BUGNE|nr:hypothetical protein EB796_011828 [Bugula neritina]
MALVNLDDNNTSNQKPYCVQLSSSPVYFDPVTSNVSVFFDDASQQVFAVRSNGVGGIIMFDGCTGQSTSFRVEDKGDIAAVRFSPNQQILALQRAQRLGLHQLSKRC